MVEPDLEADLGTILEEMDAAAAWARLSRDAQLRWLDWISNSGEAPRVRMYQAANKLLNRKAEPPRHSKIRSWAVALINAVDWWPGP